MMKTIVIFLGGLLAAVPAALAQQHPSMPGQTHGQPAQQVQADSPSTAAFRAATARMHESMQAIRYSGNADVDFVRSMIPHHEGAVAVARILLEHGRDEQTRRWAQEIIREQEREIGEMRAWLQRRGS